MNVYPTSDLSLAAVLFHENIQLRGIDRSDKRAIFVFEETPHLRETVDKYFRDELLMKPQPLLAALRKAKNALYDYKNTQTLYPS